MAEALVGFIITFKESTTESEIKQVKKDIEAKGGIIGADFALLKGFSYKIPKSEAKVQVWAKEDNVDSFEEDGIVTTQ